MGRFIDLTGKVFGRLTVLSFDSSKGERGKQRAYWLCKCECGKSKVVCSHDLRTEKTKSCGCLKKERDILFGEESKTRTMKLYGESAFNSLFSSYKRNAEKRGLDFLLNADDFIQIIKQACFYCGTQPNQVHTPNKKSSNGSYTYNGIDRINSSVGYVLENVVPCCGTCNRAKYTLSIDDFKLWIERVYNNFIKDNND